MTRNNQNQLPSNPFVKIGHNIPVGADTIGALTLPPNLVPRTVGGLDTLAQSGKWSEPEQRALEEAADFVRMTSNEHGIPEGTVLRHRVDFQTGIRLALRGLAETGDNNKDKGEK